MRMWQCSSLEATKKLNGSSSYHAKILQIWAVLVFVHTVCDAGDKLVDALVV